MKQLVIVIGGLLFGFGLALSEMAKPDIVLSFLQLTDFGLLLVLGGAVLVSILTYTLSGRMKKPIAGNAFKKKRTPLDKSTVLGAMVFGIGWGLSGLCPGSAIASVGIGNWPVLFGLVGMFLGAYAYGRFSQSG